jgi:two-component system sensor histidine kinase/response regulator
MFKRFRRNISLFFNKCIGRPQTFSIESRIFHAVVIISSILLVINGFVSIYLGLGFAVMITFGLIPVFWYMFYLSRYKRKLHRSTIIFGIVTNVDCVVSYIYCAGSLGVTLIFLTVVTFVLSIICTKRQLFFWLPVNIAILAGLLLLEFHYPQTIKPLYENEGTRLTDLGQTYFMFFIFLSVVIYYIKDNYFREKRKVELRELALIDLNASKNKLFSIIAHDLRAPLASIQNYLELLKQVYLTDEEKEYIQINLLNSTKHTSEMLTNILSWTKAQMDGVTLNFVRFNLGDVLQNTVQVQLNIANEKGIELTYPLATDLQLFADQDMLQVVVRNLINNAIKFTPAGGKIVISYEERDGGCLITIRDTGIGIDTVKHPDIFSLKNQSTTGTNNEKGVGLGLVLAKNYVEQQNGKIWFESEPGNGTTFFLSFDFN